MKVEVKNLGIIKKAELEIKPFTVIIGPNNTNKTWLTYAIYKMTKRLGIDYILLNILLLLVSLLYVTGDIPLGFINHLENVAYDYRLKLTMPNTIDERVVIIDIDEKSLAEIGRWPWGRDRLARMQT